MANKAVLLFPMAALAVVVGTLATVPTGVRSIGVCYGMNGDDLPSASDVVQLYKDNGIDAMRIYSPDTDMLQAVSGSDIAVTVGVPNADVGAIAFDPSAAAVWVQSYVLAFPAVQFRYIAVGNEVAGADTESVLPAMRNLDTALSAAGLADIKVSTAVQLSVTEGFPPSAGTFSQGYSYMTHIAQYLQSTGAPLLVNAYPYFSYIDNGPEQIDINYALFTWRKDRYVTDSNSNYIYRNLFDAMVDTLYSALENAEAGNVTVVVSETGWPSAGSNAANASTSQTYSQNLINHVGQGTPKRPGAIEAYMFATFNEEQKLGDDETRRHFGLFNKDRSPKYPIDFVLGGTDP